MGEVKTDDFSGKQRTASEKMLLFAVHAVCLEVMNQFVRKNTVRIKERGWTGSGGRALYCPP